MSRPGEKTMRARRRLAITAIALLSACSNTGQGNDGGTTTHDCPGPLNAAPQSCTDPTCTTPANNVKTFGQAMIDSTKAKDWLVVSWATSEVLSANTQVTYTKTTQGALSSGDRPGAPASRPGVNVDPALFDRILAEERVRSMQHDLPGEAYRARGTAVRGLTSALLPPGVRTQSQACSDTAPSCGATALCVIPEGSGPDRTGAGTCESALMFKFRPPNNAPAEMITATVKKVGQFGAIVADDAIGSSLQDSDTSEIIKRFDEHIAQLDHMFFGDSKDSQGKDRDGNGVVIILLTPKVTEFGARFVGFFASDDLLPTSAMPDSNAADMLYMLGPGGDVTLDALSGTIGHEYQHMINFYAKKVNRGSQREDVWLDEGLATFAEDMLGYGSDAFPNIAAYLMQVDQISLTGAALVADPAGPDSPGRRGMAHLLARYFFEQHGGASWGTGAADVADKGGIAAVKGIVQSSDTGTLNFGDATGRKFSAWVGDLLTTIAVSGAGFPSVSCNPMYHLLPPETDAYTHYPRGIDLHGSFVDGKGTTRMLNGPNTSPLDMPMDMPPVPTNGGEVRTLSVPSGVVDVTLSGPADYDDGFRIVPTDAQGG
jgi:hypothetical protein